MQHIKNAGLKCLFGSYKVQNQSIPTVLLEGQTEVWKALKLSVKAENVPKWARCSQESFWQLGGTGTMGDGAGKQVMTCEVCTENDKEGSDRERQSQ
jgi:hypothetical protein